MTQLHVYLCFLFDIKQKNIYQTFCLEVYSSCISERSDQPFIIHSCLSFFYTNFKFYGWIRLVGVGNRQDKFYHKTAELILHCCKCTVVNMGILYQNEKYFVSCS